MRPASGPVGWAFSGLLLGMSGMWLVSAGSMVSGGVDRSKVERSGDRLTFELPPPGIWWVTLRTEPPVPVGIEGTGGPARTIRPWYEPHGRGWIEFASPQGAQVILRLYPGPGGAPARLEELRYRNTRGYSTFPEAGLLLHGATPPSGVGLSLGWGALLGGVAGWLLAKASGRIPFPIPHMGWSLLLPMPAVACHVAGLPVVSTQKGIVQAALIGWMLPVTPRLARNGIPWAWTIGIRLARWFLHTVIALARRAAAVERRTVVSSWIGIAFLALAAQRSLPGLLHQVRDIWPVPNLYDRFLGLRPTQAAEALILRHVPRGATVYLDRLPYLPAQNWLVDRRYVTEGGWARVNADERIGYVLCLAERYPEWAQRLRRTVAQVAAMDERLRVDVRSPRLTAHGRTTWSEASFARSASLPIVEVGRRAAAVELPVPDAGWLQGTESYVCSLRINYSGAVRTRYMVVIHDEKGAPVNNYICPSDPIHQTVHRTTRHAIDLFPPSLLDGLRRDGYLRRGFRFRLGWIRLELERPAGPPLSLIGLR